MLYELVTGWQPFTGNFATLLGSIVSDPPTPPRKHCPDLDPALERICLKALEKEPAQRYSSASSFADVLDAWLRGERSVAASPSAQPPKPEASGGLMGRLFGAFRKPAK